MSERCQEIELGRKCVLSDGHAEEHDAEFDDGELLVSLHLCWLAKHFEENAAEQAARWPQAAAALRWAARAARLLADADNAYIAKVSGSAPPGAAASGREDEAAARFAERVGKLDGLPDEYRPTFNYLTVGDMRAALAALRARSAPRPGGQAAGDDLRRFDMTAEDGIVCMEERSDGDFVRYADLARAGAGASEPENRVAKAVFEWVGEQGCYCDDGGDECNGTCMTAQVERVVKTALGAADGEQPKFKHERLAAGLFRRYGRGATWYHLPEHRRDKWRQDATDVLAFVADAVLPPEVLRTAAECGAASGDTGASHA